MKIHSHYDNLKVSRDAPPEVIRAAYKSLAQKYHPDRNRDPRAARIFTIINAAYDVLSDPSRRADHDEWLAKKEHEAAHAARQDAPEPAAAARPQPARTGPGRRLPRRLPLPVWLLIGVIAWLGVSLLVKQVRVPGQLDVAVPPPIATPAGSYTPPSPGAIPLTKDGPRYVRPSVAPNGLAWPDRAAYLSGYPVSANDGHSTITIDNTGNPFDVHGKLIRIDDEAGPAVVRQFFIPAGRSFRLQMLAPGRYDLHYQQLDDGSTFRTEPIGLQEYATDGDLRYQSASIALFPASDGTMGPQPIAADTF
ncbi:DnaJ-like protein MG200 [Burkholderia glumae]|nr:J domain-containing protein [Burkholderia glumae]QHP92516.1 J domain-containing protein [Burkholderia glumae]QKM48445.1 DnaJ-like protein MG200 [Burkholderia glumae]UVS97116.1 J domain-containing protein [Burkholderia glumae]